MYPEHSCQCLKHAPDENLRIRYWDGDELTGIGQIFFDNLRARLTDEDRRDYSDQAVDLDENYVARFRAANVSDQLDQLVADWLVQQGGIGEVGDDAA